MTPELKIDLASEAQKAAPPIAVVAAKHVAGLSLNDWVMIATLAYIALQAGYLLWKWWKAAHTKGWRGD
jgi:hypothetical protein